MAGITEAKVYEALGLGAHVQEVAEPAISQTPQVDTDTAGTAGEGVQVQESADPVTVETNPAPDTQTETTAVSADPEDPDNSADNGAGAGKQAQTAEERRANAARRREQERQAAIDAAVQKEREKHDAEMQRFFSSAGLKNSFTGEPITSIEGFNAWKEQMAQNNREKAMQGGKMTPEILDEIISAHPVVKQAAQMVEQAQQQQQAQQEATFRADVERQLAEIAKLDPTIQSVEDLVKMPDAKEFSDIINRTRCNYLEAFKLLRMDKLNASQAEAARQQAINNVRGKEHLQPTGNARGNGAISVPDAVKRMYRLVNPTATDAEIQKHYNKQFKK